MADSKKVAIEIDKLSKSELDVLRKSSVGSLLDQALGKDAKTTHTQHSSTHSKDASKTIFVSGDDLDDDIIGNIDIGDYLSGIDELKGGG